MAETPTRSILSILFRSFSAYKWHILILGVLGFFASLLAGFGIGAVVPLLSFLMGGADGAGTALPGMIKYLVLVFDYLPFAYSFQSVLVLIIVLFVLRAAVLFVFQYIGARIRAEYKNKVTLELFQNVLYARWPFFLDKKLGFIHETILHDVNAGAKLLESFSHLMLSLISALVLLGFAFSVSAKLTLISIAAGGAILLGLTPLVRQSRKIGKAISITAKQAAQFVTEHTAGVKAVKSFSVEKAAFDSGSGLFRTRESLELKKAMLSSASSAVIEPMSVIFVVGAFAFYYTLESFSFQVFAATIFLIQRVFVYLESAQVAMHIVSESIPRVEHLNEFREDLGNNLEMEHGNKPFSFNNTLVFKNVSLDYSKGRTALAQVNLVLKKGEIVGLAGPSGSGKTTLADLCMRLIEPSSGSITIDGIESGEYNLKQWRGRVGYVAQDSFLLNETIESNIRFYAGGLQPKDIENAARQANIYDFVVSLPQGFQTVVGERGVMLSGGQRQRIALARVLARRPAILILDEATSALDRKSEIAIQDAIKSLRGNMTILIIAHRLSTIRDVDHLFIIDNGRVIEEGRPEELLQNSDSYLSRMYNLGL